MAPQARTRDNAPPAVDESITTTETTAPPRGAFGRIFESARYRDFRLLWIAQMTNSSAFWVQMVALPILVLDITDDSPVHLGLVMGIRTAPALILGLFAGVAADIWNRKMILLVTRLIVTVNALWFALMVTAGWLELWHVYVFAVMRGATMVFDQPARRAMIPSLVPESAVTNAMALNSGSVQLTRVFAAALSGVVIATLGISSAFTLIAALYISGIPLLVMLRAPDHKREGYLGPIAMLRDMREGVAFAWRAPAVRGGLIIAAVYFTFGASFVQVFIPLIARGPLAMGDEGLGTMYAVLGVGGILSTLVIAYVNPTRRRGLVLLVSLAAVGGLMALYAGASYLTTAYAAFVVVLFVGMAQSAFIPLFTALLAEAAPENMRGRVMALLAYDQALLTLGAGLAGVSAAVIGSQAALLWFAAMSIGGAVLLAVAVPAVRRIN